MEFKWFEAEVIGKTTEQHGWLWKETAYLLAIRLQDLKPNTLTIPVTFDRYCAHAVGDKIKVKFYRTDRGTWTPASQ